MVYLFCPIAAPAQQIQDSLILGPLQVEATRISVPRERQAIYTNLIDSTALQLSTQQSIAEVLSQHASLDIKSYGLGGSATISQRGMEADQTQILWNGIPLNLSSLGLYDLSLLDADMFSEVEVTPGNMSSSFGGRSVGGTVMLNTRLPDDKVSLSQGVGSYGNDRTFLKAGLKQNPWTVGVMVGRQHSSNNFTYQDPITGQDKQRQNNQIRGREAIVGFELERPEGMNAESMLWVNHTKNNIPGPVVAGTGTARQTDKSLRWLGSAEKKFRGWRFRGKGYYGQYELDYVDPQSDTYSQTLSWKTRFLVDTRKYFSDSFILNASAGTGLSGVETNNYRNDKNRRQFSVQTNPVLKPSEPIYIYPAIRYDYYSDFGGTLSPSLGMNWKAGKQLIIRISGGYNFSPPTFNDLYWEPGGNPGLLPEKSRKGEVGIRLGNEKRWFGNHDLSFYYILLDNGIQWQTMSGGIWTPRNVKRMVSRGVTWRFAKSFNIRDLNIRWNQLLDWNRSEITQARFRGDEALGNQLAYVPLWKYNTNLTFRYEKYHFNVHYQWTGIRYADNSHQSALDPYNTLNLSAGYVRSIGSFKLKGRLHIGNVTDADYQLIQWYPMPGRHIRFTLTLNYTF